VANRTALTEMEEIMSQASATAVSPGAGQPAADPQVTATAFEDIAKQITDGLAAPARLIPTFVPQHNESKAFVRRFQAFSSESIRSMITAVEANPELNSANKFDVEQERADLQFLDGFRAVVDQVEEFRNNVRFTYFARKARALSPVLLMYSIGKGLGRDVASAGVAAHMENVKRDLRKPNTPGTKRAKPVKKTPQGPRP